jgi:multidrug efflux system outer membrane protein
VADTLAQRSTLTEQLSAQRALVAAASSSFQLSSVRYSKGIDSYLTVLDAQRTLYSAQSTLISDELSEASNVVNMYKALGGGWAARDRGDGQAGAQRP